MSADIEKLNAALTALDYLEEGMVLGLGSGSTAETFVRLLGTAVRDGLHIKGVPTSERTRLLALDVGITLLPVEHVERVHITFDGADEVTSSLQLMKGGGGCLLREKIIAHASDRMVVMVDESKCVNKLGRFPLPVEVDPFAFTVTAKEVFKALKRTECHTTDVHIRTQADGHPFMTDGGHYILDCSCTCIPKPYETDTRLKAIPGVLEHGLFPDMAHIVIVGESDGARVIEHPSLS